MDLVTVDLDSVLESLRRNAGAIRALVSGVSAEQARWRPEPGKWSILEVVTHLADEEVEDFRARVQSTLLRPGEPWTPIDPEGWAVQRQYSEGVLSEALDRFLEERERSLTWLTELRSPDWSVAYEHPRFGPIRAGDLVTAWVAHDHIHIRQINRLHREYLLSEISPYSARYAGTW